MTRLAGFLIRLIPLTLVVFGSALVARAQAPDANVTINYIEAAALDTGQVKVSAFVSVVNPEGKPYTRLTTADFTVFENNTPIDQQAISVALATSPLTVTLLVDTSQNMAKPPASSGIRAIDSVKDAATAFIGALRENDLVAIYDYNRQVHRQQDFTYDHNLAIDQGVAKLNTAETAAACLYDALLPIVGALQEKPQGQRMIIVITGNPNSPANDSCDGASVDDVIEAAATTGNSIPIFSIGFGKSINQEELQRLSQRTGGRTLLAPDSTTLTDLLTTLSDQLKNQYEISYATQAASGPARVTITENSSQSTDRRQVFIPAAVEPTPTPLPRFDIDLSIDQKLDQGKLEVQVKAPTDVTLTKAELFIDGALAQAKVKPPFDLFDLDVAQLGSGTHNIRVEATDTNGTTASAEVELTLTLPPTPVPTPIPTPAPTVVAIATPSASPGLIGTMPVLSLVLIIAGLLLLVLLVGLIAYIVFFYTKRPRVALPSAPPSPPPPINPMITIDEEMPPVTLKAQPSPTPTDQQELLARRAKLVALAGQQVLSQATYGLQKLETKIGRNTAKEPGNDIPVQDQEVSRSHAKVIYQNHQFFIQDLNSSTGTRVNGTKLTPFKETALENGAEIMIGPKVTFRFEFFVPRSILETLDEYANPDDLLTKDDGEDADRTLYNP